MFRRFVSFKRLTAVRFILGLALMLSLYGVNLSHAASTTVPKFKSKPKVSVTTNSATFSWSTDVSTTAIVWYWLEGYEPNNELINVSRTSHTITISNLTSGRTYKYEVKAIKGDSVETESGTFTTLPEPEFTSQPTVSQVTETSATLSWSTNMSTNYVIWYWQDGYTPEQREETDHRTSRTITLSSLQPGTTYHYEVIAGKDNDACSHEGSFRTEDRIKPAFTSSPSMGQVTETSATLSWSTNMDTNYVIWYWQDGYAKEQREETDHRTSRTITLSSLQPGTTYHYEVIASKGNDACSCEGTFATETPVAPAFSVSPNVSSVTKDTATVSWSTNVATSFSIWYGVDGYEKCKQETDLKTSRTITLTNLTPGETYQFQVIATKGNDNAYYNGSFKTSPQFSSGPNFIARTENTATLNWTTDIATTAEIWYWIEGYPQEMLKLNDLQKTRTVVIQKLLPGETYQYEVIAANGSDAVHSTGTFTTLPHVAPEFTVKPKVDSVTEDSATLSWTTNMDTTATVWYWIEGYENESLQLNDPQATRTVKISNLIAGETYQYEIIVSKGYEGASFTGNFTLQLPLHTSLMTGPKVDLISKDSVAISWSTNVATSAALKYWAHEDSVGSGQREEKSAVFSDQQVARKVTLSDLTPGKTYSFELLLKHSISGELTAHGGFTMPLPVSGIVLNKTSLELTPEATATISATVMPYDATNREVVWSSSNPKIAAVANGKVTAIAPGTAEISAVTKDGGFKVACNVKVLSGHEKYLVIVSNELFKTVNGEPLLESLEEYQIDLIKEGWAPKIITVNNVQDGSAQHVCETPEALKNVIRTFHNKGYTGFVMIGSHPALQIAWYRNTESSNDPEDKLYADPCDIYFADMDGKWDNQRVNGANFVCPPTDFANIVPEMFFGRIYINGAVVRQDNGSFEKIDTPDKEAREVIKYFQKVHHYRMGTGPAFSNEEEKGYFIYGVVDEKERLNEFLDSQFTSITVNSDQSKSNEEDLFDVLKNEGYKAIYINAHGDVDNHSYTDLFMKFGLLHGYFPKVTSEKMRVINTKSRVVILTPCSSSRYCSYRATTNGVQEDCLGKSILYNSDYVLNIYADLAPTNLYYPGHYPAMFDDATRLSTGKSAQNFLKAYDGGFLMQAAFYGDPTIRLPKNKTAQSSIPVLLNSLNNIEVQAGKVLSLPLNIKDNDSPYVWMEITGLPESTGLNRMVNIQNGMGQTTIQWLAPANTSGQWHDISIRLIDHTNNCYKESYRIYVSPINNGMLINKAAGWDIEGMGYTVNDTDTNLKVGAKTAEFTLKDGYLHLSQNLVLEPNKDYRIIFYGMETSEVNISVGGISQTINYGYVDEAGKDFLGLEQYLDFKTGYNASYLLEIAMGSSIHKVTGKFKITGIKVVPLYWNDFDVESDINDYGYIDDAMRWQFEESGELSVDARQTRTKLVFPTREFRNFSCEFDIRVSKNQSNSDAGLFFRARKLGNGETRLKAYYLGLDAYNGLVKLGKFNNNECRQLTSYPMNIEVDKAYHVKVMAFEGRISVYINHMVQPVMNYIDQEADMVDYQTGEIGLTSIGTHAQFDNILIDGLRDPFSEGDHGPSTGPAKLIYGDVNGDRKVDQDDVDLVKQYLLGAIDEFPSDNGAQAADVDGDGNIDADDYAYMIQKVMLGMITQFPVETRE